MTLSPARSHLERQGGMLEQCPGSGRVGRAVAGPRGAGLCPRDTGRLLGGLAAPAPGPSARPPPGTALLQVLTPSPLHGRDLPPSWPLMISAGITAPAADLDYSHQLHRLDLPSTWPLGADISLPLQLTSTFTHGLETNEGAFPPPSPTAPPISSTG